jgi:hypothetical protein
MPHHLEWEVLRGSWGSRALTNGRAWVAHDHR